ncbi:MAG TPA: ABC transporter permease [Euzebya sp.]|nr:ABC transporter permease [Euzebya sp.]
MDAVGPADGAIAPTDGHGHAAGDPAEHEPSRPGGTDHDDPPTDLVEESAPRFDRMLRAALWLLRSGPVLILALLILVIVLISPVFLTGRNIGNVLAQTAVISVLAMGQLLVIVTRGIDLSVGSTLALATVVGGLAFQAGGSGTGVILAMVATGLVEGLVNGLVFVMGRIPHPFIVTLATLTLVRGLALWLSEGRPIQGMPPLVRTLGGGSIVVWLPVSTLVVISAALLLWFLSTRVVWGRWIYAVGGNPEAARRTAIPTSSVLVSVYALSGLAAGVAGVLTAGRTNAGAPTFGSLAELDAIAAVIIGGASFLGGRGTVGHALVGAVMISVIRNAMNLANLASYFQLIVLGLVILAAVESDVLRSRLEVRVRLLQAART